MADLNRVKELIRRFEALDDPRLEQKVQDASRQFVKHLKANKCPLCGEEIDMTAFRDQLSRDEFELSHICQKCQDETFGIKD